MNVDLVQPKFKAPTGAERFVLSLGRALAAKGCRVRIVCHQFDERCRPLAEGLEVDASGKRLDWSGNHYLDSIASYLQCFGLRRRFAPDADVVCVFGPALPVAALRRRRPPLLAHFCYEPPRAIGVDNADVLARVGAFRVVLAPLLRAYRAIDHWLVRRVDALLVSGPFAQELLTAEYGLPSAVITPGMSFDSVVRDRAAARAASGVAEDEPLVLSVNFLHPRKRVDLLLRAWAGVERRMPRARLVIVGEGPEKRALEALAASLSLGRVRFAGYVPEDEIRDLYAAADLLVHVARQETFGLTIVEAAAFGVPAVVTDEGGPRTTVLHGETGLRVPAETAAVEEAIASLLGDSSLRHRMGDRARRHALATYTWQRGAEDFLRACRAS